MKSTSKRKTVIGYARTSTEEQEKHGSGLEVQKEAIRNYCAAMDWELVEIVEEPAESGSSMEKRKHLQSILARVGNGEFEAIVAAKLDRIARNLKELLILHDDKLEPKGCGLVSIKDQFDTSTAQGRLFFQIIGGFAEFERSLIAERMMDGIDSKARRGQHASGSIPTGYKKTIVDGKKQIMVDEDESQIIELIFHLRDQEKMSFYKIADHLNEKGYKPKRSKTGKWINTTVQYIYGNPKYKGVYTFNRHGEKTIVVENEALRILQQDVQDSKDEVRGSVKMDVSIDKDYRDHLFETIEKQAKEIAKLRKAFDIIHKENQKYYHLKEILKDIVNEE